MSIFRLVRCSGLLGLVCVAAFFSEPRAIAKTVTEPYPYSKQVQMFLGDAETPVLFIGKLLAVNSSILACTVANTRGTKWSVSKVLYGFPPGSPVNVDFLSCGFLEPQYKSHDEMLVIAYPSGYHDMWTGLPQSVVPATPENIREARKAMDDYLRSRIRQLTRPVRVQRPRPILVFAGTILDLGPSRGDAPCVSSVPPTFPVKFEIVQVIRGDWSEKEVAVSFPGCGPLPSATFHAGQSVIAFALQIEPGPPTFFRAGFLLPLDQLAEVQRALQAIETAMPSSTSHR